MSTKSVSGTKNFRQRRWKTYTRFLTLLNTKHLVLWTTPKTLEIEWSVTERIPPIYEKYYNLMEVLYTFPMIFKMKPNLI